VLAYAAIGAVIVGTCGLVLPWMVRARPTFLTLPTSLLVSLGLYWVGGWGLGRDIELEAALVAQRERAAALAREAERAQLLALRANLDPHFLFNTLNAIAEWCRIDGAVAEQAILQLSGILRAVLEGVRAERWPIAREAALVTSLFELHALRDPGRFTFRVEVAEEARRAVVPPLLLLPLAENAMKHGPSAGHRGEVRVAITKTKSGLAVEISNPGPYKGPRPGSDGLPTVERRLALAYGDRATLRIRGEGDGTRVTLDLPEEP
jgi:LytS/YehU family sensor histidine kinase